jgi:hypothetical protein
MTRVSDYPPGHITDLPRRTRSIPGWRLFQAIILSASLSGLAAANENGFVQIFNGKDLTDWDGMPGAWGVRNGAIHTVGAKMGKNWLIWRGGEVEDFELRLSFKFTSGNSGVQVRSVDRGNWQVHGYQVEIAAIHLMGLWHESLWSDQERRSLATAGHNVRIAADGSRQVEVFGDPVKLQANVKADDWNELIVIGQGKRLIQLINGVVLAELVDEDQTRSRRSGVIALQDHGNGCNVQYKDIRLKAAFREQVKRPEQSGSR